MNNARKPSFLKNICPVCGSASVTRNDKVLGFRVAKFNCPDCGTGLTTTPVARIIWGYAMAAAVVPLAYLLARWLQGNLHITGLLLAGLYFGLLGGVGSYAFRLVLDGLVFKPWRPGGF